MAKPTAMTVDVNVDDAVQRVASAKVVATAGRDGVRTSEFWATAFTLVLASLLAAYGAHRESDALVGFASALAGLAQGSYTLGRSVNKASAVKRLTSPRSTRDAAEERKREQVEQSMKTWLETMRAQVLKGQRAPGGGR